MWAKIRDPIWVATKLLCCVPILQSFCFAAILLLIDRRDDYQLLQWILSFKQFQFWTTGMLNLLYVAAAYSFCVNVRRPDSVEECGGSLGDGDDEAGLLAVYGSWLWLWLLLASWLLQLALLWVALGLLYFSHPKVSQ